MGKVFEKTMKLRIFYGEVKKPLFSLLRSVDWWFY